MPKGYKLQVERSNYPYISVRDFSDEGSVNVESVKYISEEIYEQIKRYTISSKDIYISIAGTIGKSGIVPSELDGANLTENACKLVFGPDILNSFVYFFTLTEAFREQAVRNTRVAAQPKLALERLRTIRVPVASLQAQSEFVAKFEEVRRETRHLESVYQQKLDALAELKQSILRKAFNGELTAHEAAA